MVLNNQERREADRMNREKRKLELIYKILDRTPYLRESPVYQALQNKLYSRLTESDLFILSMADRIDQVPIGYDDLDKQSEGLTPYQEEE